MVIGVRDKTGKVARKGSYTDGLFSGEVYKYPAKHEKITITYSDNKIISEVHKTPKHSKQTIHFAGYLANPKHQPKYMTEGLTVTTVLTKSNHRIVLTELCHYLNGLRHGTCIQLTAQQKIIGHGFFKKGKYIKDINQMNPEDDGAFDGGIRKMIQNKQYQYAIPDTNQFKPKTTTKP